MVLVLLVVIGLLGSNDWYFPRVLELPCIVILSGSSSSVFLLSNPFGITCQIVLLCFSGLQTFLPCLLKFSFLVCVRLLICSLVANNLLTNCMCWALNFTACNFHFLKNCLSACLSSLSFLLYYQIPALSVDTVKSYAVFCD